MTVISSIIADAYRESNLIAIGRAPTDLQVTEGLKLLQAILSSVLGGDAGEDLRDWPLGTFGQEIPDTGYSPDQLVHPCINRRLLATNTAVLTVHLTPMPQDGSRMAFADIFSRLAAFPVTLDANGRTIEGNATKLLNVNGTFRDWMYRADLGDWVAITSKLSTDQMPFPADFDMFFITYLALRLNPRYGRTMNEQSATIFKQERQAFIARYLQSQRLEINEDLSWPFLSRQSYGSQRGFSSTNRFVRGNV